MTADPLALVAAVGRTTRRVIAMAGEPGDPAAPSPLPGGSAVACRPISRHCPTIPDWI